MLLTNIPEVTIKCPKSTVKTPGCKYCIQNIPCLCTIRTTTITYHPKLINCQENQQAITRLYPVNLALLQSFFGSEQVKSYLGDTYFKNMVNVSVPDFKLYKHKFNYILASDQIDHLSFIKIVTAAKSNEKMFQNLAETLLDGQIELDLNWPDVNGYLGLISIILGGISFIGFIYMCLLFRSLQTSLMVLQQVHNVQSKP